MFFGTCLFVSGVLCQCVYKRNILQSGERVTRIHCNSSSLHHLCAPRKTERDFKDNRNGWFYESIHIKLTFELHLNWESFCEKISTVFFIAILIKSKRVHVCLVGGSVLMQRASSESVAADVWGDLCDRSLAAAASTVCCGEPPGLCHAWGSELGLRSGDHECMNWRVLCYLLIIKDVLYLVQDGSLALSSSLHSEVALLVAEAYQKYLTDKPYSGLISEGLKQVPHTLFAPTCFIFIWRISCLLFPSSLFCRYLTLPVSFDWVYLPKRPSTNGRGNCC